MTDTNKIPTVIVTVTIKKDQQTKDGKYMIYVKNKKRIVSSRYLSWSALNMTDAINSFNPLEVEHITIGYDPPLN